MAGVIKTLALLPFVPLVLTKRACCSSAPGRPGGDGGDGEREDGASGEDDVLGTPPHASSETKAPLQTPSDSRGEGFQARTRRTRTESTGSRRGSVQPRGEDGYPFYDDSSNYAAASPGSGAESASSPRSPVLKDYPQRSGRSRASSIEYNSQFINGGGGDKQVMAQVIMAEKIIGWLRKIYWIGCVLFVLLAIEHCREAYGRGHRSVKDLLQEMPSRAVTTYLVLSLALFAFRNDFPFNLLILIVCAFCAGRFSTSVEIETLVDEAVEAARRVVDRQANKGGTASTILGGEL